MFCVLYDWVLTSGTAEILLIYHVSISCDHQESICWEPTVICSGVKANGA